MKKPKVTAHTVAINGLRATAAWTGASWGVSCWERCPNIIGEPTCRDCGAWLNYRSSRRCRKGTCEVDR